MTREEIKARVVSVLAGIQGDPTIPRVPVDGQTCPLRDLPQFDSLLALEASVEIEAELGCASEDNLFLEDGTNRPLRVDEIVDRLCMRLERMEHGDAH